LQRHECHDEPRTTENGAGTYRTIYRTGAINQWQHISGERLTDRSVALIVKSRVKAFVKQRGRSEAEADELVELISGHSLRAG
jgi:hypothetical protein